MATTKSSAPRAHRQRSSRHHLVDYPFLELLKEDFLEIPHSAFVTAFMGMPAEPKKSAIALAEWAAGTDNPGRALLAWARKSGRGMFAPAFFGDSSDDGEAEQ